MPYAYTVVTYDHWEASAHSDDIMQIVRLGHDLLTAKQRNPFDPRARRSIMASWIKRLDTPLLKPRVEGLA